LVILLILMLKIVSVLGKVIGLLVLVVVILIFGGMLI
jgi:hypothetical protein